ncbi:MAG: DoxX family protein, partial [uncultured bacterium]
MEIIFLVGKILFGGYFVYSGLNHFIKKDSLFAYARSRHVSMPGAAVLVSGVIIFLGGLGVLLGFYVRWSLALIAIFLLLVSFIMHRFWTISDESTRMIEKTNFSKNMALLGA